ncbi:EF-hand domain-containing protein [Sphingomonas sp. 8AM]|uniref:EF-hand domain-containing protein n=1 Tax=Sphingomonas sp. 8AM TaxID=2653170 RepID=UPI0012F1430F|nr:EF-hand domain-containing protein [Sphingomonas sp. 8AM]VXD02217.1 Histidine kinase [Sphingomonas sp. 8AM]
MWRYLVGGLAALSLVGAGWLIFDGDAHPDGLSKQVAAVGAPAATAPDDPAVTTLPEAPARTREQKRFERYDKDRDGRISREEYLVPRRKAFAKLDSNGDGRLTFDEWAIKTVTRFTDADRDHSGAMDAAEFAKTAPTRKASRPARRCDDTAKSEE